MNKSPNVSDIKLKTFFHNWKLDLNPCPKLGILFSLNIGERNIKDITRSKR